MKQRCVAVPFRGNALGVQQNIPLLLNRRLPPQPGSRLQSLALPGAFRTHNLTSSKPARGNLARAEPPGSFQASEGSVLALLQATMVARDKARDAYLADPDNQRLWEIYQDLNRELQDLRDIYKDLQAKLPGPQGTADDLRRTANLAALEAFAKDVRAASSQLFPGGVVPLGSDTSIPDLSALRNTCLRLANDWPISVVPRVLARPLLIREPYLELLKSLCRLPADFAVIVTGTPGIGKSTFALFFICWLAAQRQKVLFTYQSQDTKETDILLDFTDPDSVKVDKASEGKGDLWRLMAAREEGAVWRLIDGKAPPNTQYKGGGRTIVLSSPNIRNWKEFIKTGLDYVWYLPVWSLEELLTCHKLVCPNLQVDVRQRYNDFGGSARFVIGEKAHIPFELVAESLSPEQAKAVYYLSMEGTESDLRHVFAHIAVGKDHKFAGYFLGSYKMRAVVFDKAASVFWRDLVTLLRTSGRDPRLGVVAGGLLEEYGHRVLQQGLQLAQHEHPRLLSRRGKGRPPSQLTDAQKKPQQLTGAQKKPQQLTDAQKSLQAKIIQALAQPKARVIDNSGVDLGKISGSYVVPAIITNAGWDALICDGDAVYAVQTTRNSQHGLLAAAYVELRRRVPAGMDVHVLLMVPSERFERYPWQSWRDGTTVLKPKDVPAELNSMQQWAVLLEPSSDPDTMPPGDPEAATTSQLGDGDVEDDTSSNEMEE